MFLEIWLS